MPDDMTPIDEIVRGLDDLVRAGKVLYVGLSNFPAWRASAAAMLAELRGYTPIVAQQIEYSLVQRMPEQELLPMARAFGPATVGWSPLGGGVLTGKYRRGESGRQTGLGGRLFHPEDTPQKTAILDTLEQIPGRPDRTWAVSPFPGSPPRARFRSSDRERAPSLMTMSLLRWYG